MIITSYISQLFHSKIIPRFFSLLIIVVLPLLLSLVLRNIIFSYSFSFITLLVFLNYKKIFKIKEQEKPILEQPISEQNSTNMSPDSELKLEEIDVTILEGKLSKKEYIDVKNNLYRVQVKILTFKQNKPNIYIPGIVHYNSANFAVNNLVYHVRIMKSSKKQGNKYEIKPLIHNMVDELNKLETELENQINNK